MASLLCIMYREMPDLLLDSDDLHKFGHLFVYLTGVKHRQYLTHHHKGKVRYIHKMILEVESGIVDHINGNTLDCRKVNLRKASLEQNSRNRVAAYNNNSGYKGVYWRKDRGHWRAEIRVGGRLEYLGSFKCPVLAALAYNKAAVKYFGEFANLNKVEE